ncbi:MAG: hypothetical protein QOE70_6258 [Chthoniobacter sp.]|jgi:acyl transferase domain-containing protein/acyl carrier protein|nr:hypothetical protein [Chthoniobacter sp.]
MHVPRTASLRETPCAIEPEAGVKEPIAIVGIGCRLPGAVTGPDSLWKLLGDGVDAITEIPADRWNIDRYYDPEPGKPGKTYVRWGGFVDEIDRFDAAFFRITPREAASMDPQHRLLLEASWAALEDGGQVVDLAGGSDTGVFVGISGTDYITLQSTPLDKTSIDVHTIIGGVLSIAANRISYCFNFHGPSMAVDTACSSSLVAIHLACRSLWSGECSLALAGGANALITPDMFIGASRLAALSPDGRCKAFDSRANGFVRSEGVGMLALKPLSAARANGDQIYALIRGTAVNQDGRTPGLTVPSQAAQEAVLREACRDAGVSPGEVSYVEAHGTGTPVGDPIEATALGTALSGGRPEGGVCLVGSAKTNLGHLEAAAGVAGVIKAALALKHGVIPRNLHFEQPNPHIDFEKLRLRVPTMAQPFPSGRRLAGVNSFGIGGTNAHAVLEAPPPLPELETPDDGGPPRLLPLSARSPEALRALAESCRAFLMPGGAGAELSLADICYSASLRRMHHEQRLAVVGSSHAEIAESLAAFLAGESRPGSSENEAVQRPRIVFVFTGQGPQWWAMGRELLRSEPVFGSKLAECDGLVRELGGWSLLDEMSATESASRLQQTAIAQPAIFALQVALAALWSSWGIRPDAVVGHSVGEIAAAHLAGALSLEDAVRVIFHRGRCMDLASAHGRMLAVGAPWEEARTLAAAHPGQVEIAAVNSPSSVTLTGDAAALETIRTELEAREVFARFVPVNYAFHSAQMEPVREALLAALEALEPRPGAIPFFSTVAGKAISGAELDAAYWWRNVRQTVLFAPAIDALLHDDPHVFIELSAHPALGNSVKECLRKREQTAAVLPSLRRSDPERATMLRSLGALYTLGCPVDWPALFPNGGRPVRLPPYPWQREHFWHETPDSREARLGPPSHPLLGQRRQTAEPTWENRLLLELLPFFQDHRARGHVLFPAAGYAEMACGAAAELFGGAPFLIEGLEFQRPFFVSDEGTSRLQFTFYPVDNSFNIFGRTADAEWTRLACGKLRPGGSPRGAAALDEIRLRCSEEMPVADLYAGLQQTGIEYGPAFRRIEQVRRRDGEAIARVRLDSDKDLDGYQIHPALLDSCLQVLAATVAESSRTMYLPSRIGRLTVYAAVGAAVWAHAVLVKRAARAVEGDIRLLDEHGFLLAEIRGFRCEPVEGSQPGAAHGEDLLFEFQWHLKPLAARAAQQRSADWIPSVERLAAELRPEAKEQNARIGLWDRYQTIESELDQLCSAYVLEAFAALGWTPREGERVSGEALADRLGIAARHRQVFAMYLGLLAEDGILRATDGEWEVCRLPEVDPQRIWQAVLSAFPALALELTLIERCGRALPGILRGEIDPLTVIFSDGSMAASEHLYSDSYTLRLYNWLTGRAVARALEGPPAGRIVRVLEIGAGTGGTTSHVLRSLPAEQAEYVFTDVSGAFLSRAEQKFSAYPFVRYQLLDIEQPPDQQGFELHQFDLILATDALHATRDLRQTLAHVQQLLSSDGLLLLLELHKSSRFGYFIFGLTEGWWRFADPELRLKSPLLGRRQWLDLLQNTGFAEVSAVSDMDDEAHAGHTLFIARGQPVEKEIASAKIAPGAEPGSWLIFADRRGVAEQLSALLRAAGDTCSLVSPDSDVREAVTKMPAGCRGVIHLCSLDSASAVELSPGSLAEAEARGCHSVMHLVQALSAHCQDAPPQLWLATSGAEPVGANAEPLAIAQAPLWGMARVIFIEHPELRCRIVDLSAAPSPEEIRAWCDEIRVGDGEEEIALRGEARYVRRFARGSLQNFPGKHAFRHGGSENYRLEQPRAGVIDHLTLRARHRRPPGPGEVEIEVAAVGLNFLDIVASLGMFPREDDGPVLFGLECTGRIVAVGEGARDFRPGDEVIALAYGCGEAYLTMNVLDGLGHVVRKPPQLTFEEAVTLPVAFLTAYHGLHTLAGMSAGERVLIHAAAGGVGLAAVQLARQAGAEIFATAGSPEKREFLGAMGIAHVMDSRTLDFADEVMEITRGEGLDIILNSLAGEAISKGLSLLRAGGRFIEIGKRDIYQDTRIGLRPFINNLSISAVEIIQLFRERPAVMLRAVEELLKQVGDGRLRPLPFRPFPISEAANAFRYMAKAKHIGKVVLSLDRAQATVEPGNEEREVQFSSEATYLITGGLGGFGLAVAEWMIGRGARHLVLASRSGAATAAARDGLAALTGKRVSVHVVQADVSRAEAVATLLAEIRRGMPPLRGIIHAAMVLDDGVLLQLDAARFRRAMAPKADGAWNLHAQTLGDPLDFFVLFSSGSSLVGNPGQANYIAGNTFLEALAHHRRALGQPALVVNWGHLTDVGVVAHNQSVAEHLLRQGSLGMTAAEATEMLGRLLAKDVTQMAVMRMDWREWGKASPRGRSSPRYAALMSIAGEEQPTVEDGRGMRDALLAARAEERQRMLEAHLHHLLARTLGIAPARLDPQRSLNELGLDSLMAVELVNRLESDLRVAIPTGKLMAGQSLPSLAAALLELLAGPAAKPGPQEHPTVAAAGNGGEFALSAAQQEIWSHGQCEPADPANHITFAFRIRGPLKTGAIEQTLAGIFARHEPLRATFHGNNGHVIQTFAETGAPEMELVDLTSVGDLEAEIRRRIAGQSLQPFDLANGPLFRGTLLRLTEQDHLAVFTVHHLSFDGWSMGLFLLELSAFYQASAAAQPLPELPKPYSAWVQRNGGAETASLDFWKEQLRDLPEIAPLPARRHANGVSSSRGASVSAVLEPALVEALKSFARREGATLFNVMLAAYKVLFSRAAGQDEIIVASPVAGRGRRETQPLIGCFAHTLLLRTNLSGDPPFRELLQRVRRTALAAMDCEDTPFDKLAECARPDAPSTPFFHARFDFQSTPLTISNVGDLSFALLEVETSASRFDLSLEVFDKPDGLTLRLDYRTEAFAAADAERLLADYLCVLEAIVVEPDTRLSQFRFATAAESPRSFSTSPCWSATQP